MVLVSKNSPDGFSFLNPPRAAMLAILVGCTELPPYTPETIQALDGDWVLEFEAETPAGTDGGACADGTGRLTVDEGQFVGTTFSETAGVLQSRGDLLGAIRENPNGALVSFSSGQSGANGLFVTISQTTPETMSGRWKDLRDCEGTFSAVRA